MAKPNLTGSNTHRATERGYVGGLLIEPDGLVPAGFPVGSWMERVDGKPELARAIEEALDPQPGDVDLTKLSKAALEAMAVDHGINAGGLSKEDLITAIKAANDKDRTQ
jgi:hypothetical protein